MVISPVVSYIEEVPNGVHTYLEDKNHESNPSSIEWPSHGSASQEEGKV
jgi:hypothetical protein